MADDNSYRIVVLQILVVFIIFRIESIAGCQDANDLKTNHITTAVGSSVELACNVTDTQFASWLRGVQGLALGPSVYTQWRHSYSLHHASITDSSNYFVYNLVVRKVTEDVEGLYWCKEQGCSKARVNLTVEVPPVIWLEREYSNISNIINVTQNQATDIRCKAVGGKPTVSLLWEINGEDETDGVTSETAPNEVTSILNYRPNINDRMVTCKTSGQIAVPSLRASVNINVLYPPTCHILVHNDSFSMYRVTCVCVANPEVSSSELIVNKFPYDESNTVSLPVTLSAKIYCRAGNGIGVYETPVYTHTPPVTSIPPTLSLLWNGDTIVNKTYKGNETDFREDHEKYVEEGEEITLVCKADGAKPQANLTWIVNGIPKDGINSEAVRNLKENRTFDSNSTLVLNATEENITVICNSSLYESDIETLISATFFTYVKPNVSFVVDGITVSDALYLIEGDIKNITCHSMRGRPLANLTWEKNYDIVELRSISDNISLSNHTGSRSFNVTSTIQFEANRVKETITCLSNIEEANVTEKAHLVVSTCVVPELSMTINGNKSDEIHINESQSVIVICNASGARPAAKLSITRNGKLVDAPSLPNITRNNIIDSSIISQPFTPNHKDVVECVSFIENCNIKDAINVTLFINAKDYKNTEHQSLMTSTWAVPTAVIIFIILVIYCLYNGISRYKAASKSTDLSALQLALSERPVNGVTNVSRDLPAIRQSMISTHDEPSEISCNEEKLSTVTDVKMIVQLPGEGTIQYWIASGSFKQESNKKIIAKCVSESAQMKEHLNFRTLADGLTTLKKHRNITEILGVSISNVPYYIYTEYFEFGTLRDFLLRNYQQSRDSHTNVAQTLDETAIHLTGFALDVADALMFLTDRDYLHPALCARKILLNKQGICKLYDFWPKTLATERMNHILQKPLPPLAWLSPETIFLRSYSKKSDVWNFGVVIWEIYSLGEIPYGGLTCEEIEQEIRKMRYLEQPLICPGGIFSMMLASWDTSVEDRPELSEWKQKLVCLLQSVKQDMDENNGDKENGDQKYFTLENNICEYEDGYIEQ